MSGLNPPSHSFWPLLTALSSHSNKSLASCFNLLCTKTNKISSLRSPWRSHVVSHQPLVPGPVFQHPSWSTLNCVPGAASAALSRGGIITSLDLLPTLLLSSRRQFALLMEEHIHPVIIQVAPGHPDPEHSVAPRSFSSASHSIDCLDAWSYSAPAVKLCTFLCPTT